MMSELKGCLICDGPVSWCKDNLEFHNKGDECHYITCKKCGEFNLNFPDDLDWTKVYEFISDKWNNRASTYAKLEKLIDKCKKRENDKHRPPFEQEAYGLMAYDLEQLIIKAEDDE